MEASGVPAKDPSVGALLTPSTSADGTSRERDREMGSYQDLLKGDQIACCEDSNDNLINGAKYTALNGTIQLEKSIENNVDQYAILDPEEESTDQYLVPNPLASHNGFNNSEYQHLCRPLERELECA